jgi:flavodoxin
VKILVVYYSRTGNTEKIGNEIAKILKADTEQIIDKKDRSGSIGWVVAGKDGMGKKLTKIETVKKDPAKYDLVIVGTPVWVNMTPAVRTYLRKFKGKFKLTAFYCTKGGSNANIFPDMEEESGSKAKTTMEILDKEIKEDSYKEKVKNFTSQL